MSFPFPVDGSVDSRLPITADMLTHAYVTLAGSCLSLVFASTMFFAYWKYHRMLKSSYNDLYVFGIGSVQTMQAAQMIVFACFVISGQFTGRECNFSALLDQLFDSAAQILTVGFSFSLLMLRSGDFTSIGCTPSRLMRLLWPCLAVTGSVISTAVMYKRLSDKYSRSVTFFEMNLGWCWVPDGENTLRIGCAYGLAGVTVGSALLTLLILRSWSYRTSSVAQHLPVYIRLVSLMVFVLVAYLGGSIARFGGNAKRDVATVLSCFMFPAAGFFVSLIFLISESLVVPLLTGAECVPSTGFSGAVNCIVQGEVVGVPHDDCSTWSEAINANEQSGLLGAVYFSSSNVLISPRPPSRRNSPHTT